MDIALLRQLGGVGLKITDTMSFSNVAYLFLPRWSLMMSLQCSPMAVDCSSSAEVAEANSAALRVWALGDTLAPEPLCALMEPAVAAVLPWEVCGCRKLLEVSMTRLALDGRETRDWSVALLLGDGRVMSAVAWLRFCSRSRDKTAITTFEYWTMQTPVAQPHTVKHQVNWIASTCFYHMCRPRQLKCHVGVEVMRQLY